MARSGGDDLPPIEVLGAEPSLHSLQQVSMGGRGGGGRRRWPLAAGLVALVGILASLMTGGDDQATPAEDPTTTTRPTTTTPPRSKTRPTTTTTTIPIGPVLPVRTGAVVLAFGSVTSTLVDLDSGTQTEVEGLPGDVWNIVPVRGGVVAVDGGAREASFHSLEVLADPLGDPVLLGTADQLFPVPGHPDRVWLVDGGPEFQNGLATGVVARLVDLEGTTLLDVAVLDGAWVRGGFADRVIIDLGGRAYTADDAGARLLVDGQILGLEDGHALVHSCDERARCTVRRQDVATGRSAVVDLPAVVVQQGVDLAVSSTGVMAVQTWPYSSGEPQLWLINPAGESLAALDVGAGLGWGTAWLPDDHGALLVDGGANVDWLRPVDGSYVLEDVPGMAQLRAEGLFVIER